MNGLDLNFGDYSLVNIYTLPLLLCPPLHHHFLPISSAQHHRPPTTPTYLPIYSETFVNSMFDKQSLRDCVVEQPTIATLTTVRQPSTIIYLPYRSALLTLLVTMIVPSRPSVPPTLLMIATDVLFIPLRIININVLRNFLSFRLRWIVYFCPILDDTLIWIVDNVSLLLQHDNIPTLLSNQSVIQLVNRSVSQSVSRLVSQSVVLRWQSLPIIVISLFLIAIAHFLPIFPLSFFFEFFLSPLLPLSSCLFLFLLASLLSS